MTTKRKATPAPATAPTPAKRDTTIIRVAQEFADLLTQRANREGTTITKVTRIIAKQLKNRKGW